MVESGQPWRELLAATAADNLSGAQGVAAGAASVLVAYSWQGLPVGRGKLLSDLRQVSRELLRAQPAMASVVNLLNAVWHSVEREAEVVSALQAVREAAQEFMRQAEAAVRLIAQQAVELLPSGACVVTTSASSTVADALVHAWEKGRRLQVMCLESRPALEGRRLAAGLAEAGIPVTLSVDAAACDVVRRADVLFVGVDSLAPAGVVSKLGTAGLSLAARAFEVPAYALADWAKVWPAALGGPVVRGHPAEEVWAEAPPGVRVSNRYFDVAGWSAFRGVVTERGVLSSEDVLAAGRAVRVHDELVALYEGLVGELAA